MKPAKLTARQQSGSLDVVVTGLASDAHTWNLVFVQLTLEDLGHRVVNLGPCVPRDEIVGTCRVRRPDLLVVSTVNGHGMHDAEPLIAALRSHREPAGLPVVIGGKLGVGDDDTGRQKAERLLAAGYDAVFPDGVDPAAFESYVGSLSVARRAGIAG